MCFSAEADLVAGLAIGAVGVDALAHVEDRRQLPLALLPVTLGFHQFVESFVWWGLRGEVIQEVERVATWTYLAIALIVLPILVPVAARALEPARKRWIWDVFAVLGVAVAVVLGEALVRGPVSAHIEGMHLEYSVGIPFGLAIVIGYVVATCGPMLASDLRHLRWFGAITLVGAGVVALVRSGAFVSLWCVWAALASIAVAAHLRAVHSRPLPVLDEDRSGTGSNQPNR